MGTYSISVLTGVRFSASVTLPSLSSFFCCCSCPGEVEPYSRLMRFFPKQVVMRCCVARISFSFPFSLFFSLAFFPEEIFAFSQPQDTPGKCPQICEFRLGFGLRPVCHLLGQVCSCLSEPLQQLTQIKRRPCMSEQPTPNTSIRQHHRYNLSPINGYIICDCTFCGWKWSMQVLARSADARCEGAAAGRAGLCQARR